MKGSDLLVAALENEGVDTPPLPVRIDDYLLPASKRSHSVLRSGGTSGMARASPRREGSIRNLGDSACALVA